MVAWASGVPIARRAARSSARGRPIRLSGPSGAALRGMVRRSGVIGAVAGVGLVVVAAWSRCRGSEGGLPAPGVAGNGRARRCPLAPADRGREAPTRENRIKLLFLNDNQV